MDNRSKNKKPEGDVTQRHLDEFIDEEEGIIRWDMNTLSLTSSVKSKVRRYIRDGLVHKVDARTWEVWPIPGHTHQTHIVHKNDDGYLTCTCQRWRTKGLICSHILAVLVYEGKYEMP